MKSSSKTSTLRERLTEFARRKSRSVGAFDWEMFSAKMPSLLSRDEIESDAMVDCVRDLLLSRDAFDNELAGYLLSDAELPADKKRPLISLLLGRKDLPRFSLRSVLLETLRDHAVGDPSVLAGIADSCICDGELQTGATALVACLQRDKTLAMTRLQKLVAVDSTTERPRGSYSATATFVSGVIRHLGTSAVWELIREGQRWPGRLTQYLEGEIQNGIERIRGMLSDSDRAILAGLPKASHEGRAS